MSSFLGGLMSVGKKLGGAAKDWAQGTKVGRDIDNVRQGKNPWASGGKSGKPSPTPGATPSGTQAVGIKPEGKDD